MKFSIGKKSYLLKFSDNSIDLYELKMNTDAESNNFGQVRETVIGYYTGFDTLYNKLVKLHLSGKQFKDFEAIKTHIEQVSTKLKGLLTYKEEKCQ